MAVDWDVPPEVTAGIESARGGGTALPDRVRHDMEDLLGAELSAVRVHTGSAATALSRSVGAEAFTSGTDIFFPDSSYNPSSSAGRGLLAHELAHVVQQSTGTGVAPGRVSHPDDAAEVQAGEIGRVAADRSLRPRPALLRHLQSTSGNAAVARMMGAPGIARSPDGGLATDLEDAGTDHHDAGTPHPDAGRRRPDAGRPRRDAGAAETEAAAEELRAHRKRVADVSS